MLLLMARQPFQRDHSLPNGTWLHLSEAACTFTPDKLGQNSCSEHLSYGGSSLIVILNRNSYSVYQNPWTAARPGTSGCQLENKHGEI